MGRSTAGEGPRQLLLRRIFQTAIVLITAVVGYRMATGRSPDGIEVFCPFGGIETAYSLLGGGRFTCATGAGNLAVLAALLVLTILARKAFCSWICPVGTVAEFLARFGRLAKQGIGRSGWSRSWDRQLLGIYTPGRNADRALRWFRLPILVAILFFTYRTGELVFRSFDPYYILFSFHGHDVRGYSYAILAGILAFAIVVPMAWCRYLCPLGGVLWPFARFGLLRIARTEEACTGCRACDLACPHSIEVSRSRVVRSGECTLCLECTAACPRATALSLVHRPARIASGWLVPALVVLLAAGGMGGARWIRVPSLVRDYVQMGATGETRNVRIEVAGVRCVDTAAAAMDQLDELPGLARTAAYAARHELEITYDPKQIGPDEMREALEAPIYDPGSGQYVFHRFRVLEIEGGVTEP